MTPNLYAGLRKANVKEKQSSGRDEVKNGNFLGIWDKTCCAAATKLKSGRLTGILWRFGINLLHDGRVRRVHA